MAARTERQREDASLMAIAFNDPKGIDRALPKQAGPRRRLRKPWWGADASR